MALQKIIFGLGSNLGNREENINRSVELLTKKLALTSIKKSHFFANPALLKAGSPPEWNLEFLNIAVSAKIDLAKFSPEVILEITQQIEREIGRKSNEVKALWAPREIDIDILAIDNLQINLKGKLQIPHHALLERDFFVKTIAEIEKDWLEEFLSNRKPL